MLGESWISRREELRKAIEDEKRSYVEIGKQYGVTDTYIRKVAKQLGIKMTPRRKINPCEAIYNANKEKSTAICHYCGNEFIAYPSSYNIYCSRDCAAKAKKQNSIIKWKQGLFDGTVGFTCADYVKEYMLEKAGHKCEKCGWGIVNVYTHKVPLQIHHVDGNSLNNKEENLQVLCPNCHSLTENFGSRNKNAPNGKSQYYRRA